MLLWLCSLQSREDHQSYMFESLSYIVTGGIWHNVCIKCCDLYGSSANHGHVQATPKHPPQTHLQLAALGSWNICLHLVKWVKTLQFNCTHSNFKVSDKIKQKV